MTTHFIKSGNTFKATDSQNLDIYSKLPAQNFILKKDNFGIFYLEEVDDFILPKKLYGNTTRNAKRILETYFDRQNSTGVLLSGEKGSGKSLLAKTISIFGRDSDLEMPTVIINTPFKGDDFNNFIQSIEQPAVVLFDEFEKTYDQEDQEHILTLLDGVFPSKKLFVLTCNNEYKIDSNMKNRPGRIYYFLRFVGLESSFIEEYCQENLNNKSFIKNILQFVKLFRDFNFDMLKALVEEMNRYNESPSAVLDFLNISPDDSNAQEFKTKLFIKEKECFVESSDVKINPSSNERFSVCWWTSQEDDDSYAYFNRDDLTNIDEDSFTYVNEDGDIIILKKSPLNKLNLFEKFQAI